MQRHITYCKGSSVKLFGLILPMGRFGLFGILIFFYNLFLNYWRCVFTLEWNLKTTILYYTMKILFLFVIGGFIIIWHVQCRAIIDGIWRDKYFTFYLHIKCIIINLLLLLIFGFICSICYYFALFIVGSWSVHKSQKHRCSYFTATFQLVFSITNAIVFLFDQC